MSSQLLPGLTRRRVLVGGCIYAALVTLFTMWSFPSEEENLRVFGSYWASGDAANHGLNPYAQYPLTWVTKLQVIDLNLNPPTLLPLFQLFGLMDPVVAARLFTLASGILYIGTNLALLKDPDFAPYRWQIGWLFVSTPFLDTLGLGQIYMILFALGAAAWLLLKSERPILAGLFIGLLVAAKPNFSVWPALLLLSGHWRTAIAAGLTGLALFAASIGLYGIEIYEQWLAAIAADAHALITTDVSIRGYLGRLGFEEFGMPLATMLLIAVAFWTWQRRLPVLDASRIGIAVSILASPLAWFHYTLMLIPGMLDRRAGSPVMIAAGLLIIPVIVPVLTLPGPQWVKVLGGSIYFGAVCLLFFAFVSRVARSGEAGQPNRGSMLRQTESEQLAT